MAHSSECPDQYAQKALDGADIVRDAIYRQPSSDVCLISPGMRDNHEGYPELLDAYERDGLYFGAVRLIIAGEVAAFEFGLDKRGFCFSYTSSRGRLPPVLGKHSNLLLIRVQFFRHEQELYAHADIGVCRDFV